MDQLRFTFSDLERRCSRCKTLKPYAEFYKGQSSCKTCASAENRAYREKRRVELAERQRQRHLANPELGRQRNAQWRRENAQYDYERKLKWRRENLEYVAARQRSYVMAKSPEERAAINRDVKHRRRARQAGNQIFPVTKAQLRELAAGDCVYCGGPGGTVDHIRPVAKGGAHHLANLVPACQFCNSSKKASLLSEWAAIEPVRVARGVAVSPKVAGEYAQLRQAVYERLGRPLGVHLLRAAD